MEATSTTYGEGSGIRLNIGSGNRPIRGFVNVDALPDAPGVDLVADIRNPLPFGDGSVDLIYAAHVLEHFPHAAVPEMLADWRRVLREGGQLLVAVPDLDVIAEVLVARPGWFAPPHAPWIGAIYGGQKDDYDFHKTGFNAPWLAHLLSEAGFGSIRREERFLDVDAGDSTWSVLPFGRNVSLNMRAIAGQGELPVVRPTIDQRLFQVVDHALVFGAAGSSYVRARLSNRRRQSLEHGLRDHA